MHYYLLDCDGQDELVIEQNGKYVTTGRLIDFNGKNGWTCYAIDCIKDLGGRHIDEKVAKKLLKRSPMAFFREMVQKRERENMNRYLIYPREGIFSNGPFNVFASNPVDAMRLFMRNRRCNLSVEYAEVRDSKTRRIVAKYFRPSHRRNGDIAIVEGQ